ncbi:unnamed protein product [Onchocerca flexuosa]|uniref:PIR protein n=1 Tax=Onchocerca flexuosa TaxID=387005 RepID=A0A183H6I5_9BILA|nr:unnamed protein product [Onchocerca flexuosa]
MINFILWGKKLQKKIFFLNNLLIILFFRLSFANGYNIEAFCNPLFYDFQMRFFKVFPLFQINEQNPISEKNFTTDIGSILKQCKDNETILSALGIESLIDADAIMEKIDIGGAQNREIDAFRNINFKQHFPEHFFDQLMEDFEQLKKMSIELNNFTIPDDVAVMNESLHDDFNYLNNNVSSLIEVINHTVGFVKQVIEQYLYSGEIINESAQIITKEFNYAIANITECIYDSAVYFQKNSYGCRPLYHIWENVGLAVSQKISRPIQGLWVSTGLLALCFVPLIVLTALIIKFLARTNKKYSLKEVSSFLL